MMCVCVGMWRVCVYKEGGREETRVRCSRLSSCSLSSRVFPGSCRLVCMLWFVAALSPPY